MNDVVVRLDFKVHFLAHRQTVFLAKMRIAYWNTAFIVSSSLTNAFAPTVFRRVTAHRSQSWTVIFRMEASPKKSPRLLMKEPYHSAVMSASLCLRESSQRSASVF